MALVYFSLAIVMVFSALGWGFVILRQRQAQRTQQQLQQQLLALQAELTAVNSAAIGIGQRLIATERKLNAAVEKQQHLELSGSSLVPLLSGPASAEHLVERYGFSEVEARLISRLTETASSGD